MGWKTRGNRSYFYKSEREGGRVVTRYVGSGEVASLISQFSTVERERKETEAFDRKARREQDERFEQGISRACLTLTMAAEAILEGAGYHRHHRGPWRRRRNMSAEALSAPVGEISVDPIASLADRYRAGDEAAQKEVQGMLAKANKGDKQIARKLGSLMRIAPEVADLFAFDLSEIVEGKLIARAFGEESLATAEAYRVKMSALRAELAGPNPTAVERLLAERVALSWLDCHYAEYRDISAGGRSIAQAEYAARQRDRAHRRYLSALKALASVRKLPIVAVQVNVGTEPPRRGLE